LAWTVKISKYAKKMLERCDYATQTRIVEYLDDRLEQCKNPRHFGEALKGNKMGLWRYRVGDYRIICEIIDEQLIVLAIAIGHRKSYL
jgi:mRNA interferase RelE/StbE